MLVARHLHYDFAAPDNPTADHLVFSKGHASPLIYAIYKAVGAVSDDELESYRRFGSPLEGHPTPALPWVDVATGSLGQGLPIGVGIALGGQAPRPAALPDVGAVRRLGDGRGLDVGGGRGRVPPGSTTSAPSSTSTAWASAGPPAGTGTPSATSAVRAFGWEVIEIDGHDLAAVDAAYADAGATTGRPT